MSEKVTFGELIEAIAEETDHSKQFTHDFIKDFVDVINDGLEQDGRVNIAGFGKFKLKRVDERDGYNPQTEEKITIPAHNKIVFKPYKDLRELVNAPYAHLESELIEDDSGSDDSEDEEIEPTEAKSGQDDFIPTGPTTSKDSLADEQDASSDQSAGFELDTDAQQSPYAPTSGDENGDIVEFNAQESKEGNEDIDEELNEFLGTDEPSEEQQSSEIEETDSEDKEMQNDEATDFEQQSIEPAADDVDDRPAVPAIGSTDEEGKRNNSLPIVIAAGFILLLVAGMAWYLSILPDDSTPEMASQQQTEQVTTPSAAQKDKATPSADEAAANPADGSGTQQAAADAGASPDQSTPATNETDVESQQIAKGQTLWSLAEDNYGNPRLWPWIYGNNDRLADPDKILAGSSLAVPLPSGPQNQLNSADSVGVAKGFLATYQWFNENNSSKAKNHLWAAKSYHHDVTNIADIKIDKSDLAYANRAH
jgi:nucleoid DNA-binding protein